MGELVNWWMGGLLDGWTGELFFGANLAVGDADTTFSDSMEPLPEAILQEPAKKYLRLGDLECYRVGFSLSNQVWELVGKWPGMAQRTVGEQFIRAMDSVSANIAEGFGRDGKKDKIRHYRIAYGSLYECLDWNEKAKVRGLLSPEEYQHLFAQLPRLPRLINWLISYTNEKLKK